MESTNKSTFFPKFFLILATGILAILTFFAINQVGLLGIFQEAFKNFATIQIFSDLVIALILILFWMYHDTKKYGRKFWPWLLITLVIGSFGPLLYLLFRKNK